MIMIGRNLSPLVFRLLARSRSSFSIFFILLLAHIGNITKETEEENKEEEKKCESIVDKQGKSMESTRKKDSVDCA